MQSELPADDMDGEYCPQIDLLNEWHPNILKEI